MAWTNEQRWKMSERMREIIRLNKLKKDGIEMIELIYPKEIEPTPQKEELVLTVGNVKYFKSKV